MAFWSEVNAVVNSVAAQFFIRWHRMGFRLYWRFKSRGTGRPKVPRELRDLIRRMSRENPIWGAPRILSELKLLGYDVAEPTVAKYMIRPPHNVKKRRQSWRRFLKDQAKGIVAVDFFTVPTIGFRALYCFVVIHHTTRKILHVNVTEHPTAMWTARKIVEAFPFDQTPKFLIRDRDGIYGLDLTNQVKRMGIREVKTAPRKVEPPGKRKRVGGVPCVGGLHHRYTRAA